MCNMMYQCRASENIHLSWHVCYEAEAESSWVHHQFSYHHFQKHCWEVYCKTEIKRIFLKKEILFYFINPFSKWYITHFKNHILLFLPMATWLGCPTCTFFTILEDWNASSKVQFYDFHIVSILGSFSLIFGPNHLQKGLLGGGFSEFPPHSERALYALLPYARQSI